MDAKIAALQLYNETILQEKIINSNSNIPVNNFFLVYGRPLEYTYKLSKYCLLIVKLS